ncbi:hypothetical protein ACQ7CU_24055, partial [Chryseobacterium arthrosphaerae]|uniref:hypothetical protein n=1 Tax=Chryseobacterium arthrosphaerae TaxID=651561 RepID=UPI003D32F9E2
NLNLSTLLRSLNWDCKDTNFILTRNFYLIKIKSFFSSDSLEKYFVSAYLKALLRLLNVFRFSVGQR